MISFLFELLMLWWTDEGIIVEAVWLKHRQFIWKWWKPRSFNLLKMNTYLNEQMHPKTALKRQKSNFDSRWPKIKLGTEKISNLHTNTENWCFQISQKKWIIGHGVALSSLWNLTLLYLINDIIIIYKDGNRWHERNFWRRSAESKTLARRPSAFNSGAVSRPIRAILKPIRAVLAVSERVSKWRAMTSLQPDKRERRVRALAILLERFPSLTNCLLKHIRLS